MDVNLAEIKLKLYESIKDSGWANILKTFILSNDFDIILKKLYNEKQLKKTFTPPLKHVFRVFKECPYDKLKVIFLVKEPFTRLDVADGLAYSCNKNTITPRKTRIFLETIEKTVYPNGGYVWDTDMKKYANQGILFYNTALTARVGKYDGHLEIWNPFTTFLFDTINILNKNIVVVFVGKDTWKWADMFCDVRNRLYVNDPTEKMNLYKTEEWTWYCDDLFNTINKMLNYHKQDKINW